MKFKNAIPNETIGTYMQDYIDADYMVLVEIFGEPEWVNSDKIDVEWALKFADGTIATIYNWKDGPNYLGEDGLDPKTIKNWHIGGTNSLAGTRVKTAVTNHRHTATLAK